jgi:hypothetical protein
MDVAGEHVTPSRDLWLVAEFKRALMVRLVDRMHLPLWRRVTGVAVVVAAHEEPVEVEVLHPPAGHFRQRLSGPAATRVQQVAEANQTTRAALREGTVEPHEVSASRAIWNGDATRAEGSSLAKVWVGDQECCLRLPVKGRLAKQN